jgi:hypothetical protein
MLTSIRISSATSAVTTDGPFRTDGLQVIPETLIFFLLPVAKHHFCNDLLELGIVLPKLQYFAARGLSLRIAFKTFLSSLKKLLTPTIIKTWANSFPAAEFGDALFASKFF